MKIENWVIFDIVSFWFLWFLADSRLNREKIDVRLHEKWNFRRNQ